MDAGRRLLLIRALVVVWLAVWVPSYLVGWGWRNFLQLCDIAVIVTCVGLWRQSALLLSMQALSSLMIDGLWTVDLIARLAGVRLFGWTDYMFLNDVSLGLRLLSLFHVALPIVLVLSLRRLGYDRRALRFQALVAAAAVVAARLWSAGANYNFALRDPLWGRSFGPAPVHVLAIVTALVLLMYLPTHLVLRRLLSRRNAAPAGPV